MSTEPVWGVVGDALESYGRKCAVSLGSFVATKKEYQPTHPEVEYKQIMDWHNAELLKVLERIEKENEEHVGIFSSPANMAVRDKIKEIREELTGGI